MRNRVRSKSNLWFYSPVDARTQSTRHDTGKLPSVLRASGRVLGSVRRTRSAPRRTKVSIVPVELISAELFRWEVQQRDCSLFSSTRTRKTNSAAEGNLQRSRFYRSFVRVASLLPSSEQKTTSFALTHGKKATIRISRFADLFFVALPRLEGTNCLVCIAKEFTIPVRFLWFFPSRGIKPNEPSRNKLRPLLCTRRCIEESRNRAPKRAR